ncbi:PorV/PorQ family protein [bacterium]|nr:PorV/PorQ family protein [bacterium]
MRLFSRSFFDKIIKLSILAALIALSASCLYAETNGGYAGAFLRMGLGAEAIAQGNAFVARADNGFAAYYNPAGLSFMEHRTFAVSYSQLSLDRRFSYLGISFPLKPSAGLALGWINAGVTDIDGRDYDGNHYGMLSYFDNAFAFAFSNKFSDKLALGIGIKIIYSLFPEMLDDNKALKSTSVGVDFGLLYKPVRQIQIGAQVKDINGKNSWDSSKFYSEGSTRNDEYPRIYKAGIAFIPVDDLAAEYDFETSSKETVKHHFGMQYKILYSEQYRFSIRFGYDNDKPAFGFGYSFPMLETMSIIDAAYIIEEISPEDTMIFSWTILF